jgi:SulP family sulfate permease
LHASLDVARYPKERVCESLDSALIFAEDMLISRANEGLLQRDQVAVDSVYDDPKNMLSLEEEKHYALKYLKNLCPNTAEGDVKLLLSFFRREEYKEHDTIWKQGALSTSAKILVHGTFMSYLEGTTTTESICKGNMMGELGLVHGTERLSTVVCFSENAITYSISLEAWNALVKNEPRVARLVDCIVIRYLAHRVQHVSNRIFETRCLPI